MTRMSATAHLVEQSSLRVEQLNMQRHLAGSVCGTAEAGIERPNAGFETVEDSFGNLRPLNVVAGNLKDGAIHRQVVLPGGNEQVYLLNETIGIDLIMMEQRPARSFTATDALQLVDAGMSAQMSRL